jgi:hypothetical protein
MRGVVFDRFSLRCPTPEIIDHGDEADGWQSIQRSIGAIWRFLGRLEVIVHICARKRLELMMAFVPTVLDTRARQPEWVSTSRRLCESMARARIATK